jgi:hypothetical protein
MDQVFGSNWNDRQHDHTSPSSSSATFSIADEKSDALLPDGSDMDDEPFDNVQMDAYFSSRPHLLSGSTSTGHTFRSTLAPDSNSSPGPQSPHLESPLVSPENQTIREALRHPSLASPSPAARQNSDSVPKRTRTPPSPTADLHGGQALHKKHNAQQNDSLGAMTGSDAPGEDFLNVHQSRIADACTI